MPCVATVDGADRLDRGSRARAPQPLQSSQLPRARNSWLRSGGPIDASASPRDARTSPLIDLREASSLAAPCCMPRSLVPPESGSGRDWHRRSGLPNSSLHRRDSRMASSSARWASSWRPSPASAVASIEWAYGSAGSTRNSLASSSKQLGLSVRLVVESAQVQRTRKCTSKRASDERICDLTQRARQRAARCRDVGSRRSGSPFPASCRPCERARTGPID